MTPRDAYCTIADWLFYHWFTDSDNSNFNGELLEAIDKLDICTDKWGQMEEIFKS